MLGLNPEPYTLRELCWMRDGRSKSQWEHTSQIVALLHNIHRDPKTTSAITPDQANPHTVRAKAVEAEITEEAAAYEREMAKGLWRSLCKKQVE